MKTKIVICLVVLALAVPTALFAHNGGRWDGDGGGWDDEGWGHGRARVLTPAAKARFLANYPGISQFIDAKKAAGATVVHVGLENDWTNGVTGEVVVVESGKATYYYVDPQTGAVLTQYDAGTGMPFGAGW